MSPFDLLERVSSAAAAYPIVALLIAVMVGVLSTSTCPCTVPASVGIVSYVGSTQTGERRTGRLAASAFFAGIVLSLLVIGTVAAYIGRILIRWTAGGAIAAAALSLIAGLVALLGPALRRRIQNPEIRVRGGVSGAFLYGLSYGLALVATSAGPLMLLLTIAAALGRPAYGAALSLAYGIGRGLPFLLFGFFAVEVLGWLGRLRRGPRVAEVISGVALIVLAAYFARHAQHLM